MATGVSVDIKSLIKKRGITFTELSRISGISKQQLSTINTQKTQKIEFKTIYKLVHSLDCTPNDLFLISKKDG